MARFDLTDLEWELIRPLLPNKPRRVPRVDDRRVLNGIFWVLRTGSPWRDLPERYGPSTTVYNPLKPLSEGRRLATRRRCPGSSPPGPPIGDLVADPGYDARAILQMIAERGGRGDIPTQRDRKIRCRVNTALYRQRNPVERFFNISSAQERWQLATRRLRATTSLPSSSVRHASVARS